MHPIILILVFVVATVVGYLIIKQVPSLLHTPLMSGMNALSGITLLGALTAVGFTFLASLRGDSSQGELFLGQVFGGIAIIAATVNVMGGFAVTHRMLKMFDKKKEPTS
ncbi:MAG: NAD(P) transhydrogenase subunit alpha [Fermentimonas sp.]|jgi:NAD(P) transhydrogenase subunit alpha